MANLEQKKVVVSDLVDMFNSTTGIYFVDFARLTVKDLNEIRKEFRDVSAKMLVSKNTLILRALSEIEVELAEGQLAGQTAIIFAGEDATAPAKIIKKVFDKTGNLGLKLVLIEGQLYDGQQLNLVASLPSRADLMAGILGSLQSPVSGIVGSINAVIRDLASLIEEVAKKKSA